MRSGLNRRTVRAGLVALALVGSARVAEARQEVPCSYDTCALRLQHRGILAVRVVRGEPAVKAEGRGFFSRSIPVFESRTDAVHAHYQEYRSHATRAGLFGILGAVAISAGVALNDHAPHEKQGLQVALFSSGVIAGIVGVVNRSRSLDHRQRAIWLYNRELPR